MYDPGFMADLSITGINTAIRAAWLTTRSIRSCRTGQGRFWIGMDGGGMDLYDPLTHQFAHYRHRENARKSLQQLYQQYLSRPGAVTCGSVRQQGLCRYEVNANRLTAYTTRDGLPDNVIFGVLEDSAGNFWISTNKGFCQLDYRHQHTRNFAVADGLQANEFKEQAFCATRSGLHVFRRDQRIQCGRAGEYPIRAISIRRW